MSEAAIEMSHPPAQLRIGGWLLAASFVAPFALIVFVQLPKQLEAVPALLSLLLYVPSCACLGFAAHKMGRSWIIYGALPAIFAFGGGLMSFLLLKYWRQSGARTTHGA